MQQFVESIGILIQDAKVQMALPLAVNAALGSIESVSSIQELVQIAVSTSSYLLNHALVKELLSQLAAIPEEANKKFQQLKSNPMAISMIRTYLPQAITNLPLLLPMLPMFLESLASGQGPFGGMGFPFPPPPHHPHGPPHHPHGPWASHGPSLHQGPFIHRGPTHDGPQTPPSFHSRSQSQPSETKEQIHTGVRCDGCDCEPIRGVRFKCSVCANYDLCQKCEAKNIHPEHPFLKIRDAERISEAGSDSQSESSQHM
jgi:hypothetical protein